MEIVTSPTDDALSYPISSEKIKRVLGFVAKHTIEEAAKDICVAFRPGKVPNSLDNKRYYNIKTIQAIGLK